MALDRHKKNKFEGFKNFVETLEGTTSASRQTIFLNGLLEDPNYMIWAMKNLKSFNDFIELPSDEIESCFDAHPSMPKFIARLIFGNEEQIKLIESILKRRFSQIKEELSLIAEVKEQEKEAALINILKTARKLARESKIQGFKWTLPPEKIFFDSAPREGKHAVNYDNGTLALKGDMVKGKRQGVWEHYYETGKLLARGEYNFGEKNGSWEIYFANGKLRAKGKYLADSRHGTWSEFTRDGVEQVIEYSEGKKLSA